MIILHANNSPKLKRKRWTPGGKRRPNINSTFSRGTM